MSWSRRDVLAGLGLASAQAILWACGGTPRRVGAPAVASDEVRSWLREAVESLHGARFTGVHALAVVRRRTVAATDVLGENVAHERGEGVVLAGIEPRGARREHVTNDLSREGVAAAVAALAGRGVRAASVDFGPPPRPAPRSQAPADRDVVTRVAALAARAPARSTRVVYAASAIELDEVTRWSVQSGRDLEEHVVRVRWAVTRVAWHGSRPVAGEAARAWTGGLDDHALSDAELAEADEAALELVTPRAFDVGTYDVALEPAVAATLIDAATRAMLTTAARRRPELARRGALGAVVGSEHLTLIDDPLAPGAYGGYAFDDEGEPAVALTVIASGKLAGRLADRAGADHGQPAGRARRPGHVGLLAPEPSHLRVSPGTLPDNALLADGLTLEGPLGATLDPSNDRVVIAAARAREWHGGRRTGRVYADVELVGALGALLESISGASQHTRAFGIRDELDGMPRWRSIETPWLRCQGLVRPLRRPA
jgi:predicted Zn-dependent protease